MSNEGSCSLIVIDSGFSHEVLRRSRKVLACWDLSHARPVVGEGYLAQSELDAFAGDPMNHGSIVLSRLLDRMPEAPVVLVKAFDDESLKRTVWHNGQIAHPGWSEAYVWAVELCRERGLTSVANCSFGGFHHAMDGSGWEAEQLRRVTGPGRSGHLLVAAAGPGDGRAQHASFLLLNRDEKVLVAQQDQSSEYNLWFGLGQNQKRPANWRLELVHNGQSLFTISSREISANIWNQRQQFKFSVEGSGRVELIVRNASSADCADEGCALKVDCWSESAWFRNHVSPNLVSEPACFPHVIAVGLRTLQYSAFQTMPGDKPDVLLPGSEQISFRTPELTCAVARLLACDPTLDSERAKQLLGKYPDPALLS